MGGIKKRKSEKKLKRRLDDYLATLVNLPGFRKPGSNRR